jgi:uncharacterized membrane protein YraQ (UPF0718 family)
LLTCNASAPISKQPNNKATGAPATRHNNRLPGRHKLQQMYKYLLQSVEGIQWFGIVTLLLFFGTFCAAIIRIMLTNKKQIDYMSNLPLED